MIVMMQAQKAVLSLFQQKALIPQEKVMSYLEHFSDEQYQPVTVDTPLKHSIYNIIKHKSRTYLMYNTLFNSMITLSDSEFEQYKEIQFSDLSLVGVLADHGFLLPAMIDEYQYYLYYQNILNSEALHAPAHCTIALTSKCNARCIYCYEEGVAQWDMTVETAEKTAEILCASEKPIAITWFGGEPLLKTDLIQRISEIIHAHGKEFKSGLITNGSLLTEEMIANQFPEWRIEWVQISIDGMEEEYLRRKCYYHTTTDLFESLMSNIECLLNHKIFVNIRLNMDAENSESCITAAAYLKERFSNSSYLTAYPAFLSGDAYGIRDEAQRNAFSKRVYQLYPPENKILAEIPKINSCYFQQYGAFVIDTDGSVLCCERDIGRQKTKIASVQEISTLDDLKKPAHIFPETRKQCQVCAYYPKCLGGCAAVYHNACCYDACFMEKYKVEYLLNKIIDF